jgi:ADP-ribose pyrophosphatase YjhB (NUDIX family)
MKYKNPVPTVDIIIELEEDKLILINRKNPPYGWALPGGFVNYGESLEEAAIREAKEETSLDVELIKQFHTYSQPNRDPRLHTISTVYIARPKYPNQQVPKASSDAKNISIFSLSELPKDLAFDHREILNDYIKFKKRIYNERSSFDSSLRLSESF